MPEFSEQCEGRVRDLEGWRERHQSKSTSLWQSQCKRNDDTEQRMRVLEKGFYKFMGAMLVIAFVGSVIGNAVASLMNGG